MPFTFNPITGNLDVVRNATGLSEAEVRALILKYINAIVTSNRNALGNLNYAYDDKICKYVEMQPLPITDENGNLILDLEESP